MLSIITPNLNNAKYLEDNILSIQKLSIPFEHIIVDGGSTDESLNIILKYPHVKLLRQIEKTGMYGAIHIGFQEAKGEYITWVNADDQIIPSGFKAMYDVISKGTYDFVYADGYYDYPKDAYRKIARGRKFGKFFLRHGCIPTMQPSSIYTKKIYEEVGGLRYNTFKIVGDLDLFVRMANMKSSKFKYVPSPSVIFMYRNDSLGHKNIDLGQKERVDNAIPIPNLLIRILFLICRYI